MFPLQEVSRQDINTVYKMLERMVKDGFLYKIDRNHSSLEYHWALYVKGEQKLQPLELSGYAHAVLVGDIYVAMYLTGYLQYWQSTPLKHKTLEEDAKAQLTFSPNYIYFEADRNTQKRGTIASKADRYMKMKGIKFVLFVTINTGRVDRILEELPTDQGTLFAVAEAQYFLANPLGKCFVVASRPAEYQALTDFIQSVIPNVQSDVRTDGFIEEF